MHRFKIEISEQPIEPEKNIEIDKKLFSKSIPVIRIYKWKGPVISIGCGQNINDFKNFIKKGYKVVKRLSSGFAVEHKNDICFSIIFPKNTDGFNKIKQTLLKIQLGIKKSLKDYVKLNLNLKEPPKYSKFCFKTKSKYDLINGKNKISGISFYRSNQAIIYQGTINLGTLELPFKKIASLLVKNWTSGKENRDGAGFKTRSSFRSVNF